MGRRLAAFDIDGTFYRSALLVDLLDGLRAEHLLPAETGEKARLLRDRWLDRQGSFNDYAAELVRERDAGLFNGLEFKAVEAVANGMVPRRRHRVHVFTRELLSALLACGYECAAISGSPVEIVKPFASAWGFHQVLATELERDPVTGRYINGVDNALLHVKHKGKAFRQAATACGAKLSDASVAVGDTLSDLDMLVMASHPIAFNPDRELLAEARVCGIPVVLERKNSIVAFRPALAASPSQGYVMTEVTFDRVLPFGVAAELETRLSLVK